MTLWVLPTGVGRSGRSGGGRDDRLTDAFARSGLDVVPIRPGRLTKLAEPALRTGIVYLGSGGAARGKLPCISGPPILGRSGVPSSVPVLVHQSLVYDTAALETLERFTADRTGTVYIAHEGLFRPAYLELARQIALETAGRITGGVIRSTVSLPPDPGPFSGRRGRNRLFRSALLEAADSVFRLFGPPVEFDARTGVQVREESGRLQLRCVFRFRLCELRWEFLPDSAPGPLAAPALEGTLECRNGAIEFGIAPDDEQGRDRVTVTTGGGKPYRLPLPEGGGAYYLALDTLEAVAELRDSGILPPGRFFECRRAGMGLLKAVIDRYDTPYHENRGGRTDG